MYINILKCLFCCSNLSISRIWLSFLQLWLNTATATVYDVTPDDHYYPNTTYHHCHNLQHYLLNTTKYFTSNTKLLFLPGLHHLHTDLIMQNVQNILLIGSTTNGTTAADTVVQCNSSVGIVMTNITNLIVTNITVRSCLGNEYNNATVLIKQCTNVQLRHVVIEESHNSYGIVGINILGDSHFSYITNYAIIIIYNDTTVDMENHSLTIDHYHVNDVDRSFLYKVKFKLHQCSYRVTLQLFNSIFQWIETDYAVSVDFNSKSIGQNLLLVKHCTFANNKMSAVESSVMNLHYYVTQRDDIIWVQSCDFFSHEIRIPRIGVISITDGPNLGISNCSFHHNKNNPALTKGTNTAYQLARVNITIVNTVFSSSSVVKKGFFFVEMAELHLQGPVIFYNITGPKSIIRLHITDIICSNYIEFANLTGEAIVEYVPSIHHQLYAAVKMIIMEDTVINITHNKFKTFLLSEKSSQLFAVPAYRYPPCFFQYSSDLYSNGKVTNGNYSIIFNKNYEQIPTSAYKTLPLIHCSWYYSQHSVLQCHWR